LANKRIYTKQINLDGTASLFMYELKEIPDPTPTQFITREEFDAVVAQLRALVAPPTEAAPIAETAKPVFNF
jgi:hypothetical protein